MTEVVAEQSSFVICPLLFGGYQSIRLRDELTEMFSEAPDSRSQNEPTVASFE